MDWQRRSRKQRISHRARPALHGQRRRLLHLAEQRLGAAPRLDPRGAHVAPRAWTSSTPRTVSGPPTRWHRCRTGRTTRWSTSRTATARAVAAGGGCAGAPAPTGRRGSRSRSTSPSEKEVEARLRGVARPRSTSSPTASRSSTTGAVRSCRRSSWCACAAHPPRTTSCRRRPFSRRPSGCGLIGLVDRWMVRARGRALATGPAEPR